MTCVRSKRAAFTIIEALAVITILCTLAGVGWVMYSRATMKAARTKCVGQIKNLGLAYRIFATDHDGNFPFHVAATNGGTIEYSSDIVRQFLALTNELGSPRQLVCETRSFRRKRGQGPYETAALNWSVLTRTNIEYFLNLDANESAPTRLLAADNELLIDGARAQGLILVSSNRHLAYPVRLHAGAELDIANAVMSDGSVQQFRSADWPGILAASGLETNRFLLP